jgi:hypothetical protein
MKNFTGISTELKPTGYCDYFSHNQQDRAPYTSKFGVVLLNVYVFEVFMLQASYVFYVVVKRGLLI